MARLTIVVVTLALFGVVFAGGLRAEDDGPGGWEAAERGDGANQEADTAGEKPRRSGDKAPSNEEMRDLLQKKAEENRAAAGESGSGDGAGEGTAGDEKPEKPKRAATPAQIKAFEAKLTQLSTSVEKADKLSERLPKIEEQVSAQIAKITDGAGKPVEIKTMQKELAENRPSMASRKYLALLTDLARFNQQISGIYLNCFVSAHRLGDSDLDYGDGPQERRDALKDSCSTKFIEAELRVADVYERLSDTAKMEQHYKRVLQVDKENVRVTTYFKEKQEREKQERENEKRKKDDDDKPRRPR